MTSRQHVVVKRLRQLARTSRVENDGEILLDGAHLVQEAIAAGLPIELAVFSDRPTTAREAMAALADAVAAAGGRVLTASQQALAAMSPVRHPSGVVAIARARTVAIDDLFAPRGGPPRAPLVPVLVGVQDPGNVGAVVRSAAALGATGVAALDGSADPFGWKALRGAMGGTFRVSIASAGTLADVVFAARRAGVRLAAAVPRGGTPLAGADLRGPTAVLFGGEGAGLPDSAARSADVRISIPMRSPVESLNVAVAAALVLYEAARQR